MKKSRERSWWQTFAHQLKGAALVAAMIAMGLIGTPLQAASDMGYNLQACRNTAGNGYQAYNMLAPDGTTVEIYRCNDGYSTTDVDYQKGNLFQWSELDRVPHRIIISNKSDRI